MLDRDGEVIGSAPGQVLAYVAGGRLARAGARRPLLGGRLNPRGADDMLLLIQ